MKLPKIEMDEFGVTQFWRLFSGACFASSLYALKTTSKSTVPEFHGVCAAALMACAFVTWRSY